MAQYVVIEHDYSQGAKAKSKVVGRASTPEEATELLAQKKAEAHRDRMGESISFTWEEEKTTREGRTRRIAHALRWWPE